MDSATSGFWYIATVCLPAASSTAACAAAEMMGPYWVGNDRIGMAFLEPGSITVRIPTEIVGKIRCGLQCWHIDQTRSKASHADALNQSEEV